jgi:hypothetical protein
MEPLWSRRDVLPDLRSPPGKPGGHRLKICQSTKLSGTSTIAPNHQYDMKRLMPLSPSSVRVTPPNMH